MLLGWIFLLIAISALAQSAGTSYSNSFLPPNSDARRAAALLRSSSSPGEAGDRDTVVYQVRSGSVNDPAVKARIGGMLARVSRLPHVTEVVKPYGGLPGGSVSANGRIAFATVVFDQEANELPREAVKRVVDTARAAARPGVQVELGGQAIELTEQTGFEIPIAVGLLAACVVLLLTFGSLIAMGLPIVTALFGLITGLGLITLFTRVADTPHFSSELAAMIGLGVGIDYALFILIRFREAFVTQGPMYGNARESVIWAMDTAGRAILFAGGTVVMALLGMAVLGVEFLSGVAISASIGVLVVMAASVTLLPALLAFGRLGWRAERRAEREVALGLGFSANLGSAHARGMWLRWSIFVERFRHTIALLATAVMLTVAVPATALRLGSSDASNDPPSHTTNRAYKLLAKGFGEGFNGPLLVVVRPRLPLQSRRPVVSVVPELTRAIGATRGVSSVAPAKLNPEGDVATITVYPGSSPQAYATTKLVERLRDRVVPPVEAASGVRVFVGGVTAGSVDLATTLGEQLPLFIGVEVLLSAVLLLLMIRSLAISLQVALMNLLSIGAALGVIVAIFQWGWFGSLFGVRPGPIEPFIPVMLIAIVFGLSMLYEVLIMSRIYERWRYTHDNGFAVAEGLAVAGRTTIVAATVMICVFFSFVLGEDRVVKEVGLGLASAVLFDALVTRCLLLPAMLHLIGRRAWGMPVWLDRLLPHPRVGDDGTIWPGGSPSDRVSGGPAPRARPATRRA